MILQIYNRLRRTSMKIEFGTPPTFSHVFGGLFLGCIVLAAVSLNLYLQCRLGESQESIVRSRRLNVTHIALLLYCELPYNDCLCPVLLNRSNDSENCITNVQLVVTRVLPLISFMLQIFLVQELFSLSTPHRHIIIHALWIASVIIFTCMTVTIYWNSCYHIYATLILYVTGGSLWMLSCHNMMVNIHCIPDPNKDIIVTVHKSDRANNAGKSSHQLLTMT